MNALCRCQDEVSRDYYATAKSFVSADNHDHVSSNALVCSRCATDQRSSREDRYEKEQGGSRGSRINLNFTQARYWQK
jgi:hypothetical protein